MIMQLQHLLNITIISHIFYRRSTNGHILWINIASGEKSDEIKNTAVLLYNTVHSDRKNCQIKVEIQYLLGVDPRKNRS